MTIRPRLLILSFSTIESDARVLKQVRRFAGDYDVTTCGYGDSPDPRVRHLRIPDGVQISQRNRNDLLLRRYGRMYWGNEAIRAAQSVLVGEQRFDAVLANDIEAVGLALRLEPVHGVHADIHEYAPRQHDDVAIWRWLVAPYVRWMCRHQLVRAKSVTTVGDGIAAEYQRVFGIHADVVTNAAPYAALTPTAARTPLRLVHSGAALRDRGIDLMMRAVATTMADVTLDLYLMPNEPDYVEDLRALAATSPRLTVRDPVPYAELLEILNDYDAGIHVIAPSNFNNTWSLPNKFFDYVQARLALVIGPSPEMRAILQRHDLGVVAAGFEIEDVVTALDRLTRDAVAGWKEHADAAARALSAEAQVEVWASAIGSLLAGPGSGAPSV